MPRVSANALGCGAFLGIFANLRYQLLCGLDRDVINHFDVLGVVLCLSTTMRVLNVQVGETSRLAWLGMQADPLVESDNLLKAYNRPTEAAPASSSNWFISKNPIVSGLDILGIKQGNIDQEAPPPRNTRRKRIVRKKGYGLSVIHSHKLYYGVIEQFCNGRKIQAMNERLLQNPGVEIKGVYFEIPCFLVQHGTRLCAPC